MSPGRRILAAAGIAVVGLITALLIGAPEMAALLALVAGVVAGAYGIKSTETSRPARPERATDDLPGMTDLLRSVEDPMLVLRERRVIAANIAAQRLLGDHIEGGDVRLAIRHPAAAELLAKETADPSGVPARVELVGLGGDERPWELSVTYLADNSRIVRLDDQSEARAAEKMRVDFVANASHELRTPLATLLGFLETLEDEAAAGDPRTRRKFLGIMRSEARRMQSLVDDLMSLSRIEAQRFTPPDERVDMRACIAEVIDAMTPAAVERGSALVVQDLAREVEVCADASEIRQLLSNLINNGLKYGRRDSELTIRLLDDGECVRIEVHDEGEGIAPEHLPRLTERFYRVDPGRSRSVGGTGLGLAIVKHIVQRHRGRLDIESVLGSGTCVRVTLPKAA